MRQNIKNNIVHLKNNKLTNKNERNGDVKWLYKLAGHSDTNEEEKYRMDIICLVHGKQNIK